MEDLFNFDNTDNILGDMKSTEPKQKGLGISSTPPSMLDNQRSHSHVSDTTPNNDLQDLQDKKEDKKKPKTYKIALIGDPQVGKTTYLTKHLNGSFNTSYNATIGASTFHLQFNTNLDCHNYEVLDIAGQNLFAGKRDKYYKEIVGAIIMYDVMNWSSYDNICDVWLKELKAKAPLNIPIVIVGNKMENRDIRKVSVEVVAEAISQKWAPDKIGYCEISVKTNQNLAEPFLFLTKRILNINDSKALYFVSKISELNLIESMLQHKKTQDEKNKIAKANAAEKSHNLDNLFVNDNNKFETDTKTAAKGGNFLDDIIFKIADDNINNNNNDEKINESVNNINSSIDISIGDDDNFLADMMSNQPVKKHANIVTKTKTKTKSISPKTTTVTATTTAKATAAMTTKSGNINESELQNRNRAISAASGIDNKNKKVIVKPQMKMKVKPQVRISGQTHVNNRGDNNNGVMVDILLKIQETLNGLQLDVRKLQNDVNYIKQEIQRNKTQRR